MVDKILIKNADSFFSEGEIVLFLDPDDEWYGLAKFQGKSLEEDDAYDIWEIERINIEKGETIGSDTYIPSRNIYKLGEDDISITSIEKKYDKIIAIMQFKIGGKQFTSATLYPEVNILEIEVEEGVTEGDLIATVYNILQHL